MACILFELSMFRLAGGRIDDGPGAWMWAERDKRLNVARRERRERKCAEIKNARPTFTLGWMPPGFTMSDRETIVRLGVPAGTCNVVEIRNSLRQNAENDHLDGSKKCYIGIPGGNVSSSPRKRLEIDCSEIDARP